MYIHSRRDRKQQFSTRMHNTCLHTTHQDIHTQRPMNDYIYAYTYIHTQLCTCADIQTLLTVKHCIASIYPGT